MSSIKKFAILLVFLSMPIIGYTQDKGIYHALHKLVVVNNSLYLSDKYYEKGFVFSMHMDVNPKGLIDSVTFSHYRNDELGKLVDFSKIREGLLQNKVDFRKHKNEVLILLVMIMRGDDAMTTLTNGNQIRENWLNIINSTKSFTNRKQVFLTPMLISSVGNRKEF